MPMGVYTRKPPLADRFWARIDKNGPEHPTLGHCWLWTGALSSGYGSVSNGKRKSKAHRVSWEIHFGLIPEGMFVCHHCDNPTCVNPTHLFLGTQGDNMADMYAKCRHRIVRCRVKLTRDQVIDIRRLHASGSLSQSELASRFGVSATHISRIIMRRQWIDLKQDVA